MGFIKETYSNGSAGLVVSFSQKETNDSFFAGDSVKEAMEHFGLFLDEDNKIRINSDSERAMEELEINTVQVKEFREKVTNLLSTLDNETAVDNIILFPQWKAEVNYFINDRIRYNNVLYSVLQDHTSQESWTPNYATSLYTRVLRPNEEVVIPVWEQPSSVNAFMLGDKVVHNGLQYVSLVDNNVWEPGIAGNPWELVADEESVQEFIVGTVYSAGNHIMYEGAEYESLIDNNSWSPVDYPAGWQIVE